MSVESVHAPDRTRLARMHAALGDPLRLAIVDRLGHADASPGELAHGLGLATNLLAHHVSVLEAAGVVRRVRSEGDRRRTYVQLCVQDPMLLGVLGAPARLSAPRVIFVCTHNSARSQLAAAAWQRVSTVPTRSAGTRPARRVHAGTVHVGKRHGLALGRATTADLGQVRRPDDLVVAVCDNAYEELRETALHWAIPDPVRTGSETAFEQAYDEITVRVERLADATTAGPRSR